jgi:hypothetical protein
MKIEIKPGVKPDDFRILKSDGSPTDLTIKDMDRLGKGRIVDQAAPDLATLYRRMGVADDAAGTIARASDEFATNFKNTRGFQDELKMQNAQKFGKEYRRVYGNDVQGMKRFLDDNPRVLDEIGSNPNAIRDIKLRNALKKVAVAGVVTAVAAGLIASALQDYCRDKNGCRRIHSDGRVEKIVLLTCDDELLGRNGKTRITSTEVTDVPTCETQVYNPGTATTACVSTVFNPCQTNKRRSDLISANGTLAMVPNVCDTYSVRKETDIANSKRTATNTVSAACDGANVDPNSAGMCSKLCKKESFSDPNTGELTCVQMDIGDALGEVLKDLGDVFDKVLSNIPGAGAISWLKWLLIGVVVVAIIGGGVGLYLKFRSKSKSSSSSDADFDAAVDVAAYDTFNQRQQQPPQLGARNVDKAQGMAEFLNVFI